MRFAPTAEEEAKKINSQTGAGYVTDPDFWAKQGIFTGEELAISILNQTYSDLYKSVHNIRPRSNAFESVEEAQLAIDKLDGYVKMMIERERLEAEQQAAYELERKELEELMPGEFDYEELPMRSGMKRRMENKSNGLPTLAEAIGLTKRAKKISAKQLRSLILAETKKLTEEELDTKAEAMSDDEAAKAIEDNIEGKGVVSVVDFLNSPAGQDEKVRSLLRKGTEDGDVGDEKVSVGSATPKVASMVPTQNEIDLMKSISFPLASISALDNAMGSTVEIGDIIASGEHIIDGHHRWSSVASVNPDAGLKVIDLGLPGDAAEKLAVAQVAIAAQPEVGTAPVPRATTGGANNNILGKGASEIADMVKSAAGMSSKAGVILNDEILDHIKSNYADNFGLSGDESKDEAIEKIADKVGKNLAGMKAGEGPPRAYMPQFTGGETGPSLSTDAVLGTLQGGGANYKTPVVSEGSQKTTDDLIVERWQKLAGLLKG
jgi:hypothetical protein